MAKENVVAINNDSKGQELVGWLCEHGAKVVKITGVAIFLALTPQLLNAATKEEVRVFLDSKDGITPGQKDSIQYTGSEDWYLSLGDMYQNDGQNIRLFVNAVEVPFNSSLLV